MSLRIALLGMLATGPSSGYDLAKRFDGSLGYVWHAKHSQIYPELARLAAEGLATISDEGPRGRKEYRITDAGRKALEDWLGVDRSEAGTRSEGSLRMFLLPLLDRERAVELLRHNAAMLDTQVRELSAKRDGLSAPTEPGRNGWFALDLGIRQMSAMRDWALDTAARIEAMA